MQNAWTDRPFILANFVPFTQFRPFTTVVGIRHWNKREVVLLLLFSRTNMEHIVHAFIGNIQAVTAVIINTDIKRKKKDHRQLPRRKRRTFDHSRALKCIQDDYLGRPDDALHVPTFLEYFPVVFRISRSRFQVMMEDIMSKIVISFMVPAYPYDKCQKNKL